MLVIKQYHQLLPDQDDLIQQIGSRAAICYQSDGSDEEANANRFHHCIKNGHMSALEMGRITIAGYTHRSKYLISDFHLTSGSVRAFVEDGNEIENMLSWQRVDIHPTFPNYADHKYQAVKFITNRAMSHQLVRHRPASFLQESQRYCRNARGITFIRPLWFDSHSVHLRTNWDLAMSNAELSYIGALTNGLSPQEARGVLPNDTKTELIMYTSLAHWKQIFELRTKGGADPQMKALMIPVLEDLKKMYPEHF